MNFGELKQLFGFIKNLSGEDHQPNFIKVKVMGPENESCNFKIGKNVQLRKLMERYSEHIGIPQQFIRFRLDGNKLNEKATAASLPVHDET